MKSENIMQIILEYKENICVLGGPGSGKTFFIKMHIENILNSSNDEVYVIDPEHEYDDFAKKYGGNLIKFGGDNDNYVNIFDLDTKSMDEYGSMYPLRLKSDIITALCGITVSRKFVFCPLEMKVIDKCVVNIYREYLEKLKQSSKTIDESTAPIMRDFYDELIMQPEPEAQSLAISLKQFVEENSDIFSHRSNINDNGRFTVFSLGHLGSKRKELGLLSILDRLYSKMIKNYYEGKRTWICIDELFAFYCNRYIMELLTYFFIVSHKWGAAFIISTQDTTSAVTNQYTKDILHYSPVVVLFRHSDSPFRR